MTKLTLALALLLTAAAASRAQTTPVGTPYPPGSSPIEPKIIRDPVHREEALITASRTRNYSAEREADAARRAMPPTFKAQVEVTNRAAKAIKSVVWTATLTDPDTGAVIRTYDVETKAGIAPGKTKRLSKRLRTPRANVVNTSAQSPRRGLVADLKVAVKSVTYADGTTSTTP